MLHSSVARKLGLTAVVFLIGSGTTPFAQWRDMGDEDRLLGKDYVIGSPVPVIHEDVKLTANDALPLDGFGSIVALSGNFTLVGAPFAFHAGQMHAGAAYVFANGANGWGQHAKLAASDAGASDLFGNSAALSGNTALVGAYREDDGGETAGAVYVFVRNGGSWSEEAKLVASDAAAGDEFGYSVALAGDTAVVGARLDDHAGGTDAGTVYVFVRSGSNWFEQAKLTASDAAAGDQFGFSVALWGETAVVGARRDDHAGGTDAGAAYVFVRDASLWSEQAKLTASDAAADAFLGTSVALSGDTAMIGADGALDPTGGTNAGAAYVFLRDGATWSEQAKLTASDTTSGDRFGISVALAGDGDTALAGAHWDDHASGTDAGSAHLFVRSGADWSEQATLIASDAGVSDLFGVSVALSGEIGVVGALLGDDSDATDTGSAYVFELGPVDSDGDGIADDRDTCANTVIPEDVPTNNLGVNRWALVDEDDVFDTTPPPGGDNPDFEFTILDTAGCSCEQIIEAMALGWGHAKFGCSTGAMLQWIALVEGHAFGQPEVEITPGGIETLMEDPDDFPVSTQGDSSDEVEQSRLIRTRGRR